MASKLPNFVKKLPYLLAILSRRFNYKENAKNPSHEMFIISKINFFIPLVRLGNQLLWCIDSYCLQVNFDLPKTYTSHCHIQWGGLFVEMIII